MNIAVVPIQEAHVASFRECLDTVAREKRYLAQVEAVPLERLREFVREGVKNDVAQFVALDGERVVGGADVFPHWPQATAHRGNLGIGVLPTYRGKGVGKRLLEACIAKAWARGLTRIDLESRMDNVNAIRLYERAGFRHEGVKRNAMRFDGVYYDAVAMGLVREGE